MEKYLPTSTAMEEPTVSEAEAGKGGVAARPTHISDMKPVTREAYGGGMYGTDDDGGTAAEKPPASATQSADGPPQPVSAPKHKPPPSTSDRDRDITGQSYIQ
ncbi:hypothetical protein MUK42_21561 [Musa troglodytarum]|uniref:Uncharacterized protein n=1 Tax=Musa troglodytarum TaxID=320322 RepID=A0A9E7FU69_9LILI|nr:hypothetical protein MUK42_21561 [Musa troglodytarum]